MHLFALAALLNRTTALDCQRHQYRYGFLFAAIGGMLPHFTPIGSIKALFWKALVNGVIAVPS
jgi:hypothetical protein